MENEPVTPRRDRGTLRSGCQVSTEQFRRIEMDQIKSVWRFGSRARQTKRSLGGMTAGSRGRMTASVLVVKRWRGTFRRATVRILERSMRQ